MPKKKQTTTKKQPVIDYVDPETNLEEEPVTEVQPDKTTDEAKDLFAYMKRRREKGR